MILTLLASLWTLPRGPTIAVAQTSDSARVMVVVTRDAKRLPGARVRLVTQPHQTGTTSAPTNAEGIGVLRLPVPGAYRLAVSAIGYTADTLSLMLSKGTTDTTLSVELEPQPAELEELVVESTRSHRRVEEQPLRVEVLGREEVEEKLLMTPGDISMMLNETGGLRVQTTSPSLGGAVVRVQGLRGRYTLVLADGLPLYGQAGGLGLLQVPPMDLGQVEIIKGASSALYGSSALGGVINLISRPPPAPGDPPQREALLNATTLGGTDAVAYLAGRLGGATGYTMLGGWHRQGRRDRDGDGWTDVPGYDRLVLRPRISWSDAGGRSLFVTVGTTVENRNGGTLVGATAPDGAAFSEALRTTRIDAGASARFPVGPRLLAAVRVSGMTQRHRHRFGDVQEPDRHRTLFTEATLSRNLGRSIVVLGGALQEERYRSDDFRQFDFNFTVPGGFLHAELVGSDRVSLALSGRLDHHSRYGTFFNPRVSLLISPRRGWSFRASAGSGFFAPTPFTEETEVTGLSRLAPLIGLSAERARSASVDLQGLAGPLEVNATFFGSEVDHAVQLRVNASGSALVNALGSTRTYGADLVGRFRHGPLGVTASYTYTHAMEPDPATDGGVRRSVPLTPRHTAGLVAVYEAEGRSRLGIEVYYTGRQLLEDQTYRRTSRPYLIVGALGERRFGRTRIFLNLENLGGVRQTRYAPLVRPTRAPDGRWTTDVWAPLEGRVINGGLRVTL